MKERLQPLEAELAQSEEALQALLDRVPNPPAEDTPDGDSEDDAVDGQARRRSAGVRLRAARPPRPRGRARLDRRRARGQGVGLAVRLPRRRHRAARARAVPLGARPDRREGSRARAAAGARPRGGDVRHRVLPVRQGRLLFGSGGRSLSRRHVRGADGRVPREGGARRAAAALRRVLDVLPARGGRCRQGHARHVPRAPVRQGRDVRVLRARHVARRARAAARDRGGARAGARAAVPRAEHRGRRPRCVGREEVRHRGVVPRASRATARSRRRRTRPTTRRGDSTSATAATGSSSTCTR